jgi:hypothetical protein
VRFDGMRILIEEPPEAPLPVEVTPEEPPDVPSTTRPLRPGEEPPP